MKKIFVLMMFFVVCFCLSMTKVNVDASSKCEVSFHFDGLQAIAFGDPSRVSGGILDVHHHVPSIEIKQIKQGKTTLIHTIKADELKGKTLNVNMPNNRLQPKRYYSPDMNKDKQDFRWCLDIENDLFQKQLYLKDNFFAKIHFNAGMFYSENVTENKYQFVSGSSLHKFNREIGRPTLKVGLDKQDSLVISGLKNEVSLAYQPGTNYSVTISNLPSKDMMNIDHFVFYYDAVKVNVPKFMPLPVEKAAFYPKPIICDSVIFGKSVIK
ncbi:MAG: hypothetical protein JNM06_10640 [Blastocatellia bacterium]|nr:hypothetical protein [Blastocatellia bacterium]MBN8721680.1 hypothetical protein [Acidobacteriota bacterium]